MIWLARSLKKFFPKTFVYASAGFASICGAEVDESLHRVAIFSDTQKKLLTDLSTTEMINSKMVSYCNTLYHINGDKFNTYNSPTQTGLDHSKHSFGSIS